MQAITTVAVHMTRPEALPVIHGVQGDTGREAWFSVLDLEVPETASARLYARKPDGWAVYNDCTIRRVDGISTVCAPLTAQLLAAPGRALCQIQLLDGDSLVTSFPFVLDIRATRVDDTAIESSDEFGALTQALAQIQGYGAAIADAARAAADAAQAAAQAQKTADQALPRTGGTLTGDLTASRTDAANIVLGVSNAVRSGDLRVGSTGNFGLYDQTRGSWLLRSDSDGAVYLKETLVGDLQVAQGVSNGWIWRKFASGIAECAKVYQNRQMATFGSYRYVHETFPFSFTAAPIVTASDFANLRIDELAPIQVSIRAVDQQNFQAVLNTSQSAEGAIALHAIGTYEL